jgi:arylsulfatase
VIKEFLGSIDDYRFQIGTSLNAAGINYNKLRAAEIMNRVEKMEGFARPGN